jgi:hypothetical protein
MFIPSNYKKEYASMSIKRPTIAVAAAALFAAVGSASVSAQENCGFMYQGVMEAYQVQSPHYGQMLNHYNARCLSGPMARPAWDGDRHRYDYDRGRYDNDRLGYDNDRGYRGF